MISVWPTPAEAATLRFVIPLSDLRTRVLLAGALFAAGVALWSLFPLAGAVGLALILLGHLLLWVRRQTTAPGGATPKHEEVWAPVEDEWLARVEALERRGEAWDTSPWDVTSLRLGCPVLLLALALTGALTMASGFWRGPDAFLRVGLAALVLLVPLWLNGIRTTWNPSELRKKGRALAVAREVAAGFVEFEPVPMLALRQGRRGQYPVDARLMLRPTEEKPPGFLGVQVQVAMNNVQGTDYPYLYAVVLGKTPFRLPPARSRHRHSGGSVELVYERGRNEGVDFLVVRQHADTQGGWHTEPAHIREIVTTALEEGRAARRENAE